ncbi:MAG: hypothetical protein Ta2D_11280 [Rickettsiales bacterium]|nr:MAG: hypothetical protein Ta2D_11280 [Rickettsiales bacterium]
MSNTLFVIILLLIYLTGYCITLWVRAKTELEKIDKQMDRKDVGDRREFLVLTIKDETKSAGVRRAAAREYLELGYNSVVKQFIYENALDK